MHATALTPSLATIDRLLHRSHVPYCMILHYELGVAHAHGPTDNSQGCLSFFGSSRFCEGRGRK